MDEEERGLFARLKRWWKGEFVSGIGGLGCRSYYKRPWLARVVNKITDFWLRHWKILFPALVVLVAAMITAAATLFISVDIKSDTHASEQTSTETNKEKNHQPRGANHNLPKVIKI